MDDAPRGHAAHGAPIEPPDLPDGWRSAEDIVWMDTGRAARRRQLLARVALAVVVVVAVLGGLVWIAAAHYARGVDALNDGAYARAINELSAARLLVFPYRDAQSLEVLARRGLAAEATVRAETEARMSAVVTELKAAGAQLNAGDAGGVLATLQSIDAHDLQTTMGSRETARESADTLATSLATAASAALRHAAWRRAGRFAAALLVLDPSQKEAVALAAQAQTGLDLSAKLVRAKDAARHGQWRAALRIALAVVAVRQDFPGAAALIADARVALTPTPKPAATRAATSVTPPSPPPTGSSTTTPPQPPPQPPPP